MDGEYIPTKTVALGAANTQPVSKPDFKEVAKLILTNDSDFVWERIGHTGEYKKLYLDSRSVSVLERLYSSHSALSAMGLVKKEDAINLFKTHPALKESEIIDLETSLAAALKEVAELKEQNYALRIVRNNLLRRTKAHLKELGQAAESPFVTLRHIREAEAQIASEASQTKARGV